MSLYLRWGGAAVILLFAFFLGREYSAYVERRLSECESFASLISHIGGMISRFLTPKDGLWRDFQDENLERVGFLESLRDGVEPCEALSLCEGRLSLGSEAKERLMLFFSEFGREYKDGEIKRCEIFRDGLREIHKKESETLRKNVTVTRAILLASALGILILLI